MPSKSDNFIYMKSKIYSLLFLTSFSLVLSQNINFADANFKNALLPFQDVNGDGQISLSEAQNATYINIDTNNNITNLGGIEHYPNLTILMIKNNPISAPLNLSQNTQLQNLRLGFGTAVTSVDLTGLAHLKYLSIGVASNTLINVLNKPLLEEIIIEGTLSGGLSSIDVSQNPLLKKLWINNNNLTSIDVTQNPVLEELVLQKDPNLPNSISSINVTQNPLLTIIAVPGHSLLPSIDVTMNPLLQHLNIGATSITSLNLTNNPLLKTLAIDHNNFSNGINLSQVPLLEQFNGFQSQLSNLSFSNNPNLQAISVGNNYLTTLNLSNLQQLINFSAVNNLFTSLDLTNNISLQYVSFTSNQLMKYINIKNGYNQNIVWLHISDYQFMPQLTGICVDDSNSSYASKVKVAVGNNVLVTSNCSLLSTQEAAQKNLSLKVFPNPTDDILYVETKEKLIDYSIFSMSGQKISADIFRNNEKNVNVKNLLHGNYIIQIKTNRQTYTNKIVKK